jgi:hypothetical protein
MQRASLADVSGLLICSCPVATGSAGLFPNRQMALAITGRWLLNQKNGKTFSGGDHEFRQAQF